MFPSFKKFRFLGFTVHFLNRSIRLLFKQIFLSPTYYFRADTAEPFIIDCGSNIGMSVLFFKFLYPKATILAFEPNTPTFMALRKNVEENALTHVTLEQKALCREEGKIKLYCDNQTPGQLGMSLQKRSFSHFEMVDAVRLSRYIERDVDFLKMDIEGAEVQVLQDLVAHDKVKNIKQMVIEYHHHMDKNKDMLGQFLSVLENNGFGYQLSTDTAPPFTPDKPEDVAIYAYRKGS
jgi:FkbM family methyltransferase